MLNRDSGIFYSYFLDFEVNIVLPDYVTVKRSITPKILGVELIGDDRIIKAGGANDPVINILSPNPASPQINI